MKLTILQKSGRPLFFLFAIGLIWTVLWGTVEAKEVKVGYYDLERLQAQLPLFLKLNETIKEKDNEFDAFWGNLYKEYLSFYNENTGKFNKEAAGKSDTEKTQISERYQTLLKNRIKEMNDQLEKKRLQIEEFKTEQTQMADNKFKELVGAISAKKKLVVVVEKSVVLFGGTDITNDIIKKVQNDEKRDKTK